MSLSEFFATTHAVNDTTEYWGETIVNEKPDLLTKLASSEKDVFTKTQSNYGAMFYKTEIDGTTMYKYTSAWIDATKEYYYVIINDSKFAWLYTRIAQIKENCKMNQSDTTTVEVALNLYRSLGFLATRNIGKGIDINKVKYIKADLKKSTSILEYYVPKLHPDGTLIDKNIDQSE
jgi:hypothetical protein